MAVDRFEHSWFGGLFGASDFEFGMWPRPIGRVRSEELACLALDPFGRPLPLAIQDSIGILIACDPETRG